MEIFNKVIITILCAINIFTCTAVTQLDKQLIDAAEAGHLNSVIQLVAQGADVLAENNEALKKSAGKGHVPVVRYLIAQIAHDPATYLMGEQSSQDNQLFRDAWNVAFEEAVSEAQAEVVRFLVGELPEGLDQGEIEDTFANHAQGCKQESVRILLTELPQDYWPNMELLNEAARWATTGNCVDLLRYYLTELPENKRPNTPVLDNQLINDAAEWNARTPTDAVRFLVTELPEVRRANVHAFENPALWVNVVGLEDWKQLFTFLLTELPEDQRIHIPVLDSAFITGIARGHTEEVVNFFMSLPEPYRPTVAARNQALQRLAGLQTPPFELEPMVSLVQHGADWTLLNPAQQTALQQYILTQLQSALSNRNWSEVEQLLSTVPLAFQQNIQNQIRQLLIPAVDREIQGLGLATRERKTFSTLVFRRTLIQIIGPAAYRYYYNIS